QVAAVRGADRAVGAAFWRRRGARRVQCAAASARPAFTSPKGSSPPCPPLRSGEGGRREFPLSRGGDDTLIAEVSYLSPSTVQPRVIVPRSEPQAQTAVSEIPPIGPGKVWCGRAGVSRPGDVGRHVVFKTLVDRLHPLHDSHQAGFRIGLHE